jgi:uncharacterized protein (DUF2235 family)
MYQVDAESVLFGRTAYRSCEALTANQRPEIPGRNLVVCLDGTSNEPEVDVTNVARLFDMAIKDDGQLVYYDPGVGAMGARTATTPVGKSLTRSGLRRPRQRR